MVNICEDLLYAASILQMPETVNTFWELTKWLDENQWCVRLLESKQESKQIRSKRCILFAYELAEHYKHWQK